MSYSQTKKIIGLLVVLIPLLFTIFQSSLRLPVVPNSSISPTQTTAVKSASDSALFPVTKVVDGDTIEVAMAGKKEKVRLIGVNTPESVDPRKTVECFGKEASLKAKELIGIQQVRLVSDPTQDDRDKYHRLLRYVFLADGTLINKKLIEDGYGFEYTYDIPYQYQTEFKAAEKSAREANKGLWNEQACNYNNEK